MGLNRVRSIVETSAFVRGDFNLEVGLFLDICRDFYYESRRFTVINTYKYF
jgi:hypothetical protein